jgi:drug/metabolite transporter (DMT)-like permease
VWTSGHVNIGPRIVVAMLALGGINTGVAYLLIHSLLRDTSATGTSMVTYVSPVVAVALGAAVLGERFGWELFVGGLIVLAGVAAASLTSLGVITRSAGITRSGRRPRSGRRLPNARARRLQHRTSRPSR